MTQETVPDRCPPTYARWILYLQPECHVATQHARFCGKV